MGYRTQNQENEAMEAAKMESAKKETIAAVYDKHQDFVRCEANDRAIIEAIVRWTQNVDVLPTAELFEIALEADPGSTKEFARQPIAHIREQIVEEILDLLASKNGGRDGKFDSFNLRSEEARMKPWSLEALRQRLSDIKVRQRMAAAPVSELKKFVADSRPKPGLFPGWPTLPQTLVPPGEIHAVNVTAEWLNGLAKTNLWLFKRLVKLYGPWIDHRRGIK
jgi:hypothetical protein